MMGGILMRCLFCKQDSSNAKSVEHIVPESLGNKHLILPKGYICDKCNNYFARKIEKPFLEELNMRTLRFAECVPNKKGKIPAINGLLNSVPVKIHKELFGEDVVVGVEISPDLIGNLINETKNGEGWMLMSAFNKNDLLYSNHITSRFIAKIALEALANEVKDIDGGLDDLIDNPQFDPIRNYVRLGNTQNWPCNIRRIYDPEKEIQNPNEENDPVQIVCEYKFLFPNLTHGDLESNSMLQSEIYFIISLWGIEYAINMGGPVIDGYEKWLNDHNGISPLYHNTKI